MAGMRGRAIPIERRPPYRLARKLQVIRLPADTMEEGSPTRRVLNWLKPNDEITRAGDVESALKLR
jgi:hypothetical protein